MIVGESQPFPIYEESVKWTFNYCPQKIKAHGTIEVPLPVQEPMQTLPYHVHRTASQRLPVYHMDKGGGGNLRQTKIRKISGNIEQLSHDIQQALGLADGRIVINQLTKHIIIKVFLGGNRNNTYKLIGMRVLGMDESGGGKFSREIAVLNSQCSCFKAAK